MGLEMTMKVDLKKLTGTTLKNSEKQNDTVE